MILIIIAAIFGGSGTFILLLSYGVVTAFLAAPLGGSLLAFLAAVALAFRKSELRRSRGTNVTPVVHGDVATLPGQ
jgi:hypothetical protein